MYQSIPKPPIPARAIPGRLTRVKLRTLGNLTQNEVRLVGHLTFVSKRLSAVGSRRISQFFDSAGEPRPRVIALVHSTWVFLLLSFYIVLSWNMPLFKVWSEDKLNKKFVVAENFAELVSTVCVTCLEGGGFDPLWSSNGWGIRPSKLATWRGIWPKFFKKVKCPGVCLGGQGRFWNWPLHYSWMWRNIHEVLIDSLMALTHSVTHSILINLLIKVKLNTFSPTSPAKYCFCPNIS